MLQRLLNRLGPSFANVRRRSSLGRKLTTVFLPLVLVPMIIIGLVTYFRTRSILQDEIETDMINLINAEMVGLSDWVAAREEQIIADSQDFSIKNNVEVMLENPGDETEHSMRLQYLRTILEHKLISTAVTVVPFDEYLIVRSSDGLILASTDPDWEGSMIETEIMRDILLSEATTYAVTDHPIFRISTMENIAVLSIAPMGSSEGGVNEVLLIGLSTDHFKSDIIDNLRDKWVLTEEETLQDVSAFILLDPRIVLNISRLQTLIKIQTTREYTAWENTGSATTQTNLYSNVVGRRVLGAYRWIPTAGIGLALELPEDIYLSEINSLAPFFILLVIAVSLFTAIVVPYASNRLIRPLSNLTEFAQRMASGDWQYRIPVETADEIGTLSESLNTMAEAVGQSYRSLEERVADRTRQLRIASQVARVVISSPSLEDLLRRGVELIKSQFGYYHVSIFLIDDEGESAQLAESTGEVGQALKARGHSLKIGGQSVIGWVTENNQPRIAYDVTQDPLHLSNELLPETRSEAAVPLQIAGRVLGALDVQSTEPEAFAPQDIEILQTLADQFCAAIQNAKMAITSISAADRARLMSQVTQELSRQMTVEDVMQTTAKSLHRALGHPEIVVRMKTDNEEPDYFMENPAGDNDR